MTIESKVEWAASAKASGFRYVRSDRIAVVTVRAGRSDPSTSLRVVLQACAARFQIFLASCLRAAPMDRVLLFAATSVSNQQNVISRRRGIWGDDSLRWLTEEKPRSPSVEVVGEQGSRFVGLADVGEAFFEAADFTRTHQGSLLLVSPRVDKTEERVRALVAKVFPKGKSSLDWSGAVELVEEGEDVCIRASGGFDDKEAAIDAFLSDALLRKVGTP